MLQKKGINSQNDLQTLLECSSHFSNPEIEAQFVHTTSQAILVPFRNFLLFHLFFLQPLLLLLDLLESYPETLEWSRGEGMVPAPWLGKPIVFHGVAMPAVLTICLATTFRATPPWWTAHAKGVVGAYSFAVQALTMLHIMNLCSAAGDGDGRLHHLLIVCLLPFVCTTVCALSWRWSCSIGVVVLALHIATTFPNAGWGWKDSLSRASILVLTNVFLFFAALYAESVRRSQFRQNINLLRFQEGAQAFENFKLKHERLLKKIHGLQQAKEVAEEKSRAKTLFLANTCHELRTPLNGVIGMIGVLKNTSLTQEQKEYVETVESSGEALLDLVNDILDFSKIESGKIVLEDIEFDVRGVVEEVAEMMSFRAHSKALELITYIPHDLITSLVGDSTRLRQILTNLVSNGVKFTERGLVAIQVKLVSFGESHAVLQFEVQDTGIGVSETMVHQLFEPWTQANQSTFRKYGGSGLGLAISKQLVELFEGNIHIRSEEGKGSAFIFTAKFKRPPMRPASSRNLLTRDMIRQVRNTRCLIVESNPLGAASIRETLLSLECYVKTVSSCSEANALLNTSKAGSLQATAPSSYDVIFIDSLSLNMEREDTANLLAHHPDKYFILMTRITERGVLRINASNFSSLAKPVKRFPLLDCLVAYKEKSAKKAKVPDEEVDSGPSLDDQRNGAGGEELAQKRPINNQEEKSPITLERIFESMQSHDNSSASGHSIDASSFLMAEGNRTFSVGARILLVEDNITNQRVAVRMLTRLGQRCDIAENGLQAVNAVSNNDYLLVLMDMRLPGMDGITATQEIRRVEREGRTCSEKPCTIIAMTADASSELREKALQAGMQDVLTKPVRFEMLKEVLEKYIIAL